MIKLLDNYDGDYQLQLLMSSKSEQKYHGWSADSATRSRNGCGEHYPSLFLLNTCWDSLREWETRPIKRYIISCGLVTRLHTANHPRRFPQSTEWQLTAEAPLISMIFLFAKADDYFGDYLKKKKFFFKPPIGIIISTVLSSELVNLRLFFQLKKLY